MLAHGVGGAAPRPAAAEAAGGAAGGAAGAADFLEANKEALMADLGIDTDEAWEAHKRAAVAKYLHDRESPLSPHSHVPRTVHLDADDRVIDERAIADAAARVGGPLDAHAGRMLGVLLNNPGWSNSDKLAYFQKMAELSEYIKGRM